MKPITNLCITDDVSLITISHMPNSIQAVAGIFGALSDAGINIDMISQSPAHGGNISMSFSLVDADFTNAMRALGGAAKADGERNVQINAGNIKLALYGEPMRETPGVAARVFAVLAENDVEIKLVTTSETDISLLIDQKDADVAVNAIKTAFDI